MAYNTANLNSKYEEIKYINWINSRLSPPPKDNINENYNSNDSTIQVDHIGDNLTDGILLLKLLDTIFPEKIDWSKIDKKANNKFKQLQNCSYLISIMKDLAIPIASLGGRDIVDGQKDKLFAVLWLLMRAEFIKENGVRTDEEIRNWANQFIYNNANNKVEADEPDWQP